MRYRRTAKHSHLVDRAADVFFCLGYNGASTQDIADAVGILKGSLYHYIDSKEDLLFDILVEVHAELRSVVERPRNDDAATSLRDIIMAHVLYVADNHAKAGVCAREFRFLSPGRMDVVRGDRVGYERVLVGLVERGQTQGCFRADLDARIAAKAVLGMLKLLPHWYQSSGTRTAEEIGDQLATIALSGLRVPDAGDTQRSAVA